jgi:hypothetical protein
LHCCALARLMQRRHAPSFHHFLARSDAPPLSVTPCMRPVLSLLLRSRAPQTGGPDKSSHSMAPLPHHPTDTQHRERGTHLCTCVCERHVVSPDVAERWDVLRVRDHLRGERVPQRVVDEREDLRV